MKRGGSTIRTYINSQGQIGSFQELLNVYGKKGEPCVTCGTILEKQLLAEEERIMSDLSAKNIEKR